VSVVRISKDPADYRYEPPPERTRRAALAGALCLRLFPLAVGVAVLIRALA
jgi:hypothetical protein